MSPGDTYTKEPRQNKLAVSQGTLIFADRHLSEKSAKISENQCSPIVWGLLGTYEF